MLTVSHGIFFKTAVTGFLTEAISIHNWSGLAKGSSSSVTRATKSSGTAHNMTSACSTTSRFVRTVPISDPITRHDRSRKKRPNHWPYLPQKPIIPIVLDSIVSSLSKKTLATREHRNRKKSTRNADKACYATYMPPEIPELKHRKNIIVFSLVARVFFESED